MSETIPTKVRLANAIREFNPNLTVLIGRAEEGYYDDYESTLPTPQIKLVQDLRAVEAFDLAKRVMDGEFDGTKEESDAWYEREGKHIVGDMLKGGQR